MEPPFLLLDKSRARLESLLLTNEFRIPIHKYRVEYDKTNLTVKTEIVETGPIVQPTSPKHDSAEEMDDESQKSEKNLEREQEEIDAEKETEEKNKKDEENDNVLVEENMFYGTGIHADDLLDFPKQAFVTFIPGCGWVFKQLLKNVPNIEASTDPLVMLFRGKIMFIIFLTN